MNAGSNSAPDSNEYSENAIYQKPLDLGLLKEEEDRKKHSSSTTSLKLSNELSSVEETLKTAGVRGTELNAKVENQRKGSFFQGATCITNSKSDICQESDIGLTIQSHFPSNDPQPCPRCSSIRALMKAVYAEKMLLQTQWTESRKYCLTKAYRCFLNHRNIKAVLPKYKLTRGLPYIPPEEHLDQIIACANQILAVWLQTLKETAVRPCEAYRIEGDDWDIDAKILRIIHPAKGGNPRALKISDKLVKMYLSLLGTLPKEQKRTFAFKSLYYIGKTFRRTRKKAIQKFGNPELRKIDFYTNRYWQATMTYRRTGDFGAVMVLLGHKSLKYVLLYAQLSQMYGGSREYVCKDARTRQEAMQLIEAGFDYVMSDKEGVSLFRKLK
jgi:integrase